MDSVSTGGIIRYPRVEYRPSAFAVGMLRDFCEKNSALGDGDGRKHGDQQRAPGVLLPFSLERDGTGVWDPFFEGHIGACRRRAPTACADARAAKNVPCLERFPTGLRLDIES